MAWLTRSAGTIALAVRAQPRASRDEIAGLHGDRLEMRLAGAREER